jgi:hemoglobin
MMKKLNLALASLLLLGSVQIASAAEPTLYEQLGGDAGVTKIIDGMVGHVAADTRINSFFANANIPRLKKLLVEQVCAGAGGPCTYKGQDMVAAHKGMKINSAQFNALVEDLQKSLADNNVDIGAGNKLLAMLAPMKTDVDNK